MFSRFSQVCFRQLLRRTYPWLNMALRLGAIAFTHSHHRTKHRLRLWRIIYQIDFAALIAGMIELSQPEFWV
ncbi:MAG: hypothetical protein AAFY26_16365 [Cyanobacteria bacterium J06638_22]